MVPDFRIRWSSSWRMEDLCKRRSASTTLGTTCGKVDLAMDQAMFPSFAEAINIEYVYIYEYYIYIYIFLHVLYIDEYMYIYTHVYMYMSYLFVYMLPVCFCYVHKQGNIWEVMLCSIKDCELNEHKKLYLVENHCDLTNKHIIYTRCFASYIIKWVYPDTPIWGVS